MGNIVSSLQVEAKTGIATQEVATHGEGAGVKSRMKVVITGGAGFIGSHLVDKLFAAGHEVLVLDNFATGRRDNLQQHPHLTVAEGTIADADWVRRRFAEFAPDRVVHAAASYKRPNDWEADLRTNVMGAVNIVRESERAKVARLVYLNTALCYGPKPDERPVRLGHPIRPEGSYAVTKSLGEDCIARSGLDFVSLRLANVYGPRNVSGPLPAFYRRLSAGESCIVVESRRDFVFIDDLVEVAAAALGGVGERGAYHVSSGADHSIRELFDAVATTMGVEGNSKMKVHPRGADDVETILVDPSRTELDFGWRATTPLAAGVARAVAYYRAFGVAETYSHLRTAA
jgi:UDP-glucose 4-epimerase